MAESILPGGSSVPEPSLENYTFDVAFPAETLDAKAFWGTMFNNAQNNVFLVIKEVLLRMGVSMDEINKMTPDNIVGKSGIFPAPSGVPEPRFLNDELKMKRLEDRLYRHFPFLVSLREHFHRNKSVAEAAKKSPPRGTNQNQRSEVGSLVASAAMEDDVFSVTKVLGEILKELEELRNAHNHHIRAQAVPNDRIERYLYQIFRANLVSVKERFKLDEKDVEHLRSKNKQGLKPDFKYKLWDKETKLTQVGALFLVCQFLEKRQIFKLLPKFKHFKDSRTMQKRATLQTFSMRRIIVPKLKIKSMDAAEALALDMAHELDKCPEDLWELFKDEQKRGFLFSDESENEEGDWQPVRVRYRDRFAYFALSFLDQNNLLPGLKFQVNMGTHYHKIYSKVLLGGILEPERRLGRRILGYGNPVRLAKRKDEAWDSLILRPNEIEDLPSRLKNPFVTDSRPRYHIVNNNIGLKLTGEEIIPDLGLSLGLPEPNLKPDFWVSTYELPILVFLCLNGLGEQVVGALAEQKGNFGKLIDDILDGKSPDSFTDKALEKMLKEDYRLQIQQIPERIKNLLNGKGLNLEKVKRDRLSSRLLKMRSENERWLEQLRDNDQLLQDHKVGKQRRKYMTDGQMATCLVRDMIKLQPSLKDAKGKDKITGANYAALQFFLATYGQHQHRLGQIFKDARLIDSSNPHPFLKDIQNIGKHRRLSDFFHAYLVERSKYLTKIQEKLVKSPGAADNYSHLFGGKKRRFREKNVIEVAKAFLDQPIYLQRGFFYGETFQTEIRTQHPRLNAYFSQYKYTEKDNEPKFNFSFFLKWYLAEVLKDEEQDFFKHHLFSRTYPIMEQEGIEIEGDFESRLGEIKDRVKVLRSVEPKNDEERQFQDHVRSLLNKAMNNEKKIRLFKTQDVVLFMMLRRQLSSIFGDVQFAAQPETMKLKAFGKKNMSVFFDSRIRQNIELLGQSGLKLQVDAKLKDWGKTRWLVHDHRVASLKSLNKNLTNNHAVPVDILLKELELFEKHQVGALKEVLGFEKRTYEEMETKPTIPEGRGAIDIQTFLEHKFGPTGNKAIKELRNGFAHGQYKLLKEFTSWPEPSMKNGLGLAKWMYEKLLENLPR